MIHRVKATREGLVGHPTASGITIVQLNPTSIGLTKTPILTSRMSNFFVALPSLRALGRIVRINNPKDSWTSNPYGFFTVPVLDIGPWNTDDDPYVFGDSRPQAESGTDTRGRKTNGAGIDLSEAVWTLLGMTDNGDVEWEFI